MEGGSDDGIIAQKFQGEIIKKSVHNENGEEEIIEYQKSDCISKSRFSKCYKCLYKKTKEIFILKELKEKNEKLFINERDIHQKLNHQNIVKLVDFLDFKNKFYLLLEFCENRDLTYHLNKKKKWKKLKLNIIY